MANNKIDRINKEIAKTREKITEYQNKLKGLEAQKTEAENLEIVQLVRAMRMTPQELNAMLKGDTRTGKQPRKERRIYFMANNKIDRINKEIAKTREKITEYQNKLKGLEAQKTEAENLEIVQLVRAMRMTPQDLNDMLKGDTIPGMSAAPDSDEAADYEEQEDNADEE